MIVNAQANYVAGKEKVVKTIIEADWIQSGQKATGARDRGH